MVVKKISVAAMLSQTMLDTLKNEQLCERYPVNEACRSNMIVIISLLKKKDVI